MNKSLHALTLAGFVLLVTLFGNNQAVGQNVSAQISAREAWVGSPIVLQIKISNASKYCSHLKSRSSMDAAVKAAASRCSI